MKQSRFILAVAAVAILFVLMAHCTKMGAQQYQFSQGTYLTVTTMGTNFRPILTMEIRSRST